MPNGYTVVPGLIPGPLTVGGPLIITNGQIKSGGASTPLTALNDELRVGAASPFMRVMKTSAIVGALSYNIAKDQGTRDDATKASYLYQFDTAAGRTGRELDIRNAGGFLESRVIAEWGSLQGSLLPFTGNLLENDAHTHTIVANTLGPHGALAAWAILVGSAQGVTASTFRYRLGGVLLDSFTKAAVANVLWLLWLFNTAATNAQDWFAVRFDSAAGVSVARGTAAVDTTLDQVLKYTVQLGTATDNWSGRGWRVSPFGSFDVSF